MSARLRLAWVAAAALVACGLLHPSERAPTFVGRLLGPITSLTSSLQIVRADVALREGRPGDGYALMESALRLDPGATDAWGHLAHHLVFERGSPAAEPDPRRRLAWVREGLATLRRGAEVARRPDVLDLQRGLSLLVVAADAEEDLPWPGGARSARRAAVEAFERAAEAGNPLAAELASEVRERP